MTTKYAFINRIIELCVPHSDLLESLTENSDLILVVDGSYFKTKSGSYQAAYTATNLSSPLECNPLSEVKSALIAEFTTFIGACQLAKD